MMNSNNIVNDDQLLDYMKEQHSYVIDYDNEGQIVIYTGLYEDEDGNIHTTNPNEEEN